jgi:hypothetical protein
MDSSEMEKDPVEDPLDLGLACSRIDDIAYGIISLNAPSWYINPTFKTIFAGRMDWDCVSAASQLTMAPGIEDVIAADAPPCLDVFRSLPQDTDGLYWAIYAIVMEKHGCRPCLYIGSGTNADHGARMRVRSYNADASKLPRFVKLRFTEGFHIGHIGLLCWTPCPSPGLVPRVRARFLALETAFTVLFHAAFEAITDAFLRALISWPRQAVEWNPLCSHLPIREAIRGNTDASPEELEIIAALRSARLAEITLERSRRFRAKKTKEDPEGFLKKCSKSKLAWSHKNRDRVNSTASKGRASRIMQNLYHCNDCDISLQSAHSLEMHLLSQRHRDRFAGIAKDAPSTNAVSLAAARTKAKENKTHHCTTCNKSFENDWSLTRHLATALHARRVRDSHQ